MKGKTSQRKIFLPFFLEIYGIKPFSKFFYVLITKLRFTNTKLYTTPLQEYAHTSMLALHTCDLRPWSSWTANSDKKLNVNKPCVTSWKTAFRKFAKFFVNFQDVTSFGKILKKLNANFGKILRKKKFFKIFVNFKENLTKILIELWKYFAISKRF